MNQPKKSQTGSSRPAGKPAVKKQQQGAGAYLMNWLGRQVGHVKGAVKAEVSKKPGATRKPATNAQSGAKPAAGNSAAKRPETSPPVASEKIIYREDKIEEAVLPDRPGVILRRTIIDEVVVETEIKDSSNDSSGG